MRFSTGTVFSALVAFAAAYTQPDYTKGPEGNAVRAPGLNDQVPEGAPYEIKWDTLLGDRVSLVLLRGPSTNVVPLETIVENIPNTGHYTWTPGYNLEVDTTHYGLLIVVEGTGAYQWSSQFGIAKGKGSGSTTTTTTAAGSGSGSGSTVTVIEDVTTTYCPESETAAPSSTPLTITTVIEGVTTTICPEEEASSTPTGVSPISYSTQVSSVVVTTTDGSRVPHVPSASSTLKSTPLAVVPTGTASATASATPVFNGAGRTSISLGAVMAGLFAVLAF
ncbi:GPI anchored serine-threonine rich protein [Penicillium waksmanii]|uniref:GPI anchored serine-threonine rich protein n=1 Tax=Penicillium waksmanii TaxID=69791 RepID=UPI00254787F4|nr:GPI anchored serine-threonine rich protein [Penicillium waksmanii]KAJ6000663.1 GPI anchored serine-threonine rich protein [Penicillium waksmanii]